MASRLGIVLVAFACVGVALAMSDAATQLKARADAAHGGEQAKLCLEYAHSELEDANTLFTNGDVDKAQSEVVEVVAYAHKAAEAATSSGKHLKQTEIELRKLSKRVHDIAQTLNVEDRPPLLKAVDDLEQIRSDLLAKMFGQQAEPKGKS